ncbi:MAG: potassium transporter TrkA [Desulfobacteraceae bacterium]|nr:MAG: potassium transporter TrkA [Desulfobacteraceae bacterium]
MDILVFIGGFIIIALASKQIGHMLISTGLPLISGFLFTGMLAGPYVLDLIQPEALSGLRFVDEVSLGFIAFAAGNELYLKELKHTMKSIVWVTCGLVLSTFTLCSLTFFFLSGVIPFMQEMTVVGRAAVSILAGSIMVARSPSSAIAIVNELRAKGPFTQTVLGVTVIMDVVVITLFALCSSVADGLFSGARLEISFAGILVLELFAAVCSGVLVGKWLRLVMMIKGYSLVRTALVLLSGYAVFYLSAWVHHYSQTHFSMTILLEPLLICMIASFYLSNFCGYRLEFSKIIQEIGPAVYIAFFTLTGASLALDVMAGVWVVTLTLFVVRTGAIFIGSFTGGALAGNPLKFNRLFWMSFITQAGVGLGLAKEVIVAFPEWGTPFATIIISVIILNQITGPPLFKRSLKRVREAHSRADVVTAQDGGREAFIFGLNRQSLGLAHLLDSHGWRVKIGTLEEQQSDLPPTRIPIFLMEDLSLRQLRRVDASKANAIVGMLSDEENFKLCELAYEYFGTENMIVRLNNRENYNQFHELGVLVVEPGTAIVSLLDNFVRSPSTASMLLGMGKHQDVFDLAIRNPALNGLALANLRLPLDTIITSIHRNGRRQAAHGAIRLRVGDVVTVVGSLKSIEELALRFDTNKEQALLHIVEKVRAREFSSKPAKKEMERIIRKEEEVTQDDIDEVIRHSITLDLTEQMSLEKFFLAISHPLSERLDISASSLLAMLIEREKEMSTVLSPDLAVPHIIVEGEDQFCLLLVRCIPGIHFSQAAPAVSAVVVLVGSRDRRTTHLKALSAIARIALDPHFKNKWERARNEDGLRRILLGGGKNSRRAV